jgi:hypothetical protein
MANDHGEIRFKLFDTMLAQFPPGRLIDLGAGHGKFSVRASEAGWKVTAVDARTERFPEDPSITWINEDVRTVDLSDYDVIACLGLFYHLTIDDQLSLLDRAAGTPLILDTHVGVEDPTFRLSEVVQQRGYRGRLYQERNLSAPTASWENTESFWPTPRALQRMLGERGYVVLTATPWYRQSRTFFLCLPAA